MDMGFVSGLGFGMLGSAIDAMSQDDTNYNNRAIAEETNASNEWINQQQLAWAREQYKTEKAENRYLMDLQYSRDLENRSHNEEYNSPKALMERYRQAGLNPYLMMSQGHLGSVSGGSSMSGYSGSNPHANQPNMIPMQTGAPMQAYTGFGKGISQGLADYLAIQASQREDARLQSDLAYQDNKMELEYMEYLSNHQFRGSQAQYWKNQIDEMRKDRLIRENDYQLKADWQNFQKNAIQYDQQCRATELHLQELATRSGIQLNAASAANLRQLVEESIQRVDSMKHSDTLSENQFWHQVQEDIFRRNLDLRKIGISEDMIPSQKFHNYIGGVIDAVGTGTGIYLGLKHGGKNYVKPTFPGSTPGYSAPNVTIPKYGLQY